MKTEYWIKLTKVEVEHVNSLIKLNEEEGSYTPPKNQYWSRSARIRKKLDDISKTCYMFQSPNKIKRNAHLANRCLMAFEEILFNHLADAVVLPEEQINKIKKLIKDLQP